MARLNKDSLLQAMQNGDYLEAYIDSRSRWKYRMVTDPVSKNSVDALLRRGLIKEVRREYYKGNLRYVYYELNRETD